MKLGWVALFPAVAAAHMVSMSTGDLKVDGRTALYELRMPAYEAAHVANPERILLDHIHFRSNGSEGKPTRQQCTLGKDNFTCTVAYEFPEPVERLTIDCTFAAVTVPNHVHLLRASRGDKTDQAVFDLSFTTAEIRFRPPAPWEVFVRESGSGFLRAVGGLAPLLFLLGLVLAARNPRELVELAVAFLAAEIAACFLAPQARAYLSPRFIEAAAALTIAYLAFEVLLLPDSQRRWPVVAVLGLFHGAYFSLFLDGAGYHLGYFVSGVAVGELLVLAILYPAFWKLLPMVRIPKAVPALASVLLAVGVGWFLIRVWA
jgi:hypothetical protein